MTPQEVKNSILQLAIQGKLVEQRAEEGTSEELYRQIQAKKKRLVKEGKIKKEKPLPEIAEEEVSFEIPESWMWMRLGTLCNIVNGFTPSRSNPDFWDGEIPWFTIDDVREQGRFISHTKQSITNNALSKNTERIVPADTVLLCCTASVGEYAYTKIPLTTNQQFNALVVHDVHKPLVYSLYLYTFVQTLKDKIIAGAGKTTFNFLSVGKLKEFLIPLPPLAEQKRIVAKIEELLPYIDRYEQARSKLEAFNKRFPSDMQKSILQTAIQGRLVEQRPEEGTGEELYRQIQAEKQWLVKEGKIKKEKPLPEITEEEVPFDIPESWKWVRLNSIAASIVDCPHSTPRYFDAETQYCTIDTNCINEKGNITKWRYVDCDTYEARIARLTPQKDDIVYTREGSICRAAILPEDKKICLGQRVMLIRCAKGVSSMFVRRLLMSPMVINKLTEQQKGIGAKHVNVSDVCRLLLPLPPLAEQKRIVAKLEQLLPQCELLK